MSEQSANFLRVKNLSKHVSSGDSLLTILEDVNLDVQQGESLAILGASGSGKTTLLTLLAGLDLPTGGDIYFQNHPINSMNEEQRTLFRGENIGFIFQSFQLLPTLTALENVMLPLEIRYVKSSEAKAAAGAWLGKVGLGERLQHYPGKLSGGEQQRVAIARAFVNYPKLILADEMTGNLDKQTGELVANILFALNQEQNITLILVTHDVDLASRCQRRLLLSEGKLHPC